MRLKSELYKKEQDDIIDKMYVEDNIPNNFAIFLNIDIQGAELLALKGMGELLHHFDYAYIEVNHDYVYKKMCISE